MKNSLTVIQCSLLMVVFGFLSMIPNSILINRYVDYAPESAYWELPRMSQIALDISWVYVALPAIWLAFGAYLVLKNHQTPLSHDSVTLFCTTTLFLGIIMLGFFVLSATLPFIGIVASLSGGQT